MIAVYTPSLDLADVRKLTPVDTTFIRYSGVSGDIIEQIDLHFRNEEHELVFFVQTDTEIPPGLFREVRRDIYEYFPTFDSIGLYKVIRRKTGGFFGRENIVSTLTFVGPHETRAVESVSEERILEPV